jgi:hypothetical protein
MREVKFTPGPWHTVRDNGISGAFLGGVARGGDLRIVFDDREDIAYVRTIDCDLGNANASLIAAAPALYAALEGVRAVLDRVLDDHGLQIVAPEDKAALLQASDALRAARGEEAKP